MLVQFHPGQSIIFIHLQTLNYQRPSHLWYLNFRGKVNLFFLHDIVVERNDAIACPRVMSEDHLVEEDADTPDIAFWCVWLFAQQLGTHVEGSADRSVGEVPAGGHGLGKAKISQFELFPLDDDVLRFEIPTLERSYLWITPFSNIGLKAAQMHLMQCKASLWLNLWDGCSISSWVDNLVHYEGCLHCNILGRYSSCWGFVWYRPLWRCWDGWGIDGLISIIWLLWLCRGWLPLHHYICTFGALDYFYCVGGVWLLIAGFVDCCVGTWSQGLLQEYNVVVNLLFWFGFAHSDIIIPSWTTDLNPFPPFFYEFRSKFSFISFSLLIFIDILLTLYYTN